jgi:transposase
MFAGAVHSPHHQAHLRHVGADQRQVPNGLDSDRQSSSTDVHAASSTGTAKSPQRRTTKPLLPKRQRRRRWPGRKPLDDRACLNGILFVLATGIRWDRLPQQLGYGSGMTCWRRLRDWQAAGVWERLHALLLAELHAAGRIDWSRAVADSSHIRAKRGTTRSGQARSTGAGPAASITC